MKISSDTNKKVYYYKEIKHKTRQHHNRFILGIFSSLVCIFQNKIKGPNVYLTNDNINGIYQTCQILFRN